MHQTSQGQQLKERAEKYLMANYGVRDVTLVRGEGSWAWDADGGQYLDFLSGIGVNNLGHCHPAVVEAIQAQSAELIHCSNAMMIKPQIELAELLVTELGMTRAMFANSGAEVTEGAIKLARIWGREKFHSEKYHVMVFTGAFHGRTYGAMSATYSPKVREGFDPFVPGFVFAEFNNIDDVDAKWTDNICAVMLESVQGEGGIRPANAEFLQALRERCTERNAALILDEVQCGMGRSGRRMAYQHADVEPDIVPIAKALGGGVPIGVLLARGEFADVFTKGRHGTTFGGNPLACAAGLAACKVIFDDEFLAEVSRKACKFWGLLEEIGKGMPDLFDHVRGLGMMQGMVLKKSAMAFPAIARKHGLIINVTADKVVRILPPLTASDEELDEGARRLGNALREFVEQG
ncbi:MAG: aspartate aminotransferase family protein [Candidatus Sumerlaeia bacterium]|nr:aspartate aminotransferase family protein [Candidatus Sumerlaeia bacterium]